MADGAPWHAAPLQVQSKLGKGVSVVGNWHYRLSSSRCDRLIS